MSVAERFIIPWWEAGAKEAFSAILFDIDGVLVRNSTPLPGAREFFNRIVEQGFPHMVLTNDSARTHREKAAVLASAGFRVDHEDLVSPASALEYYLEKHGYANQKFFVFNDQNIEPLRELGIEIERDPFKLPSCDAIIIGEYLDDLQEFLWQSFNTLIERPDMPVFCPNPDPFWPSCRPTGFDIGSGSVASMLKEILHHKGIDLDVKYMGKPYRGIYDQTLALLEAKHGVDLSEPKRILMIGDTLKSDVAGAVEMGLSSALLLSGTTSQAMVDRAYATRINAPDYVFDGFSAGGSDVGARDV